MIHTVKSFSVVNEVKVYVFLELLCFLHYPTNVGSLVSGPSALFETRLLHLEVLNSCTVEA